MRKSLSPQDVRRIGIWLNGGRTHGWAARVASLMDVPIPTVRTWALPPTSSSSRSIKGPAVNLLLAYVAMQQRDVPPDVLAAAIEATYRAGWDQVEAAEMSAAAK